VDYRVIFFIRAGAMVLLHGFQKASQKTPKLDLDLALKRKKEIESADRKRRDTT
jgi:phage-related protein